MKKYLFNEDGTIKTLNMLVAIILVLILAIIIIYLLFFKDKALTDGGKTLTSKNVTSTINMCKDCELHFNKDEFVLVTNMEYPLEEILAVKNISLASLKFDIANSDYLTIERNKDNELVLKTKDIIGETSLMASYDKLSSNTKIIINEGEILSLSLLDHPYYIYLNKENPIEVISNPQGIDTSKLNLSVSDEAVVSLRDGKMIGNKIGSAKLYLVVNENTYEQDVYVVNDMINIQVKNGTKLESVDKIKIDKKEDINIIVTLDDNANVGLTNESLNIIHIDEGISGVINYDGKNLGVDRSYKYRISIDTLEANGKMTIKFNHPDGTSKSLVIYNETNEDR